MNLKIGRNKAALFLPILTILFFLMVPAVAAQNPTAIRVLLGPSEGQVNFQVEQGQYLLIDVQSGLEIGRATPGTTWSIKKEGNNLKLFQEGRSLPGVFGGPLQLCAEITDNFNLFRYQGVCYRGNLDIYKDSRGLMAVNTLDLEQYLYGVVAQEMGVTAPLEALKAQAIVSRSYTLSALVGAKSGHPYDVVADVSNQVYQGYDGEGGSAGERVRQAVDTTCGQVIYYDNRIIEAFYHSNSGGHTEDSENVWNASLPYLRGVPSPEDVWALEYPQQSSTGWPARNYSWDVTLTSQQLRDKVNSWLLRQGKVAIGNITNIVVSKVRRDGQGETASGRVTRLDIYTAGGCLVLNNNEIRSALGLQSTLFNIQMGSAVNVLDGFGQQRQISPTGLRVLGADGMGSAPNGSGEEYFVTGLGGDRKLTKTQAMIVIQGKGNGHGVGMSQWGAMGMAVKGYTCQQIIEHYYNQGLADGRLRIAPHHR